MAEPPRTEFGKRRPQPRARSEPMPKRSSHVALLLMGTLAVGGAAYALMPSETCTVPSPGMAQPNVPQASPNCTSRGSSGGYGHSSRYSFFGGDSSSRSSSSSPSSESSSSSVSRGGFGSLAHAFGFSGRS